MAKKRGPYDANFPIGTNVRIANRAFLEEFTKTWRYHHPPTADQLDYAEAIAVVEKLGYSKRN